MAQENVGINIQVGGNQDQALGSLKAQLREATAEVTKLSEQFGATSKEAVQAAKRAAELKDQIGDAKSLIDAFNPDAKFKALTASLGGVAGGFSALQGATALFGKENEDLQKTLLKVQSAMALSQGLQAVGESIDSFKQLGTVIKTQVVSAFSTLRGAVIATGLGALAVVIGLVIANFDKVKQAVLNMFPGLGKLASFIGNTINAFTDLIGVTNAATRAEQQRQAVYTKSAAGTKVVNEGIDRQIKLLQAQGAEQGKIDALKKQSIQNELNDLKKAANDRGLLFGEQSKKYKDLQNDLKIIDATAQKAREDEAKKANEKSATAGNKYAEDTKKKAQADAQERLDAEKEALEKLSELRNQLFLSTFKNENDKKKAELNLAFIKEKDEILANTKITEATRNELIIAARLKLNADLDTLKATEKEKQDALDAKMLEDAAAQMQKEDELEFANLQKKFAKTQDDDKKAAAKEIADIDKKLLKNETDLQLEKSLLDQKDALIQEQYANSLINEEQYNAALEANSKARTEIDKIETATKIENAMKISSLLGSLSDVIGKETAAGKAFAIAQATIDTYLGATKAYQSLAGIPFVGPALGVAAAGVAIAGGIKNVKSILAVKVPGGGGGGGANISAPSLSGAPIAPPQPQAATTNISTQSINALGNQAQRAYVVESDVTSNQQRMAAIQQRARFG
jgi:hypothetical protein